MKGLIIGLVGLLLISCASSSNGKKQSKQIVSATVVKKEKVEYTCLFTLENEDNKIVIDAPCYLWSRGHVFEVQEE